MIVVLEDVSAQQRRNRLAKIKAGMRLVKHQYRDWSNRYGKPEGFLTPGQAFAGKEKDRLANKLRKYTKVLSNTVAPQSRYRKYHNGVAKFQTSWKGGKAHQSTWAKHGDLNVSDVYTVYDDHKIKGKPLGWDGTFTKSKIRGVFAQFTDLTNPKNKLDLRPSHVVKRRY